MRSQDLDRGPGEAGPGAGVPEAETTEYGQPDVAQAGAGETPAHQENETGRCGGHHADQRALPVTA